MEFTLSVRCTADDTMDVTSNDLQLDPNHPGVAPVGAAQRAGLVISWENLGFSGFMV